MFTAPSANVDTELVRSRVEAAFQRAHHRRRDARRVPIHAHHRTESLEPEGITQTREQLGRAVMEKNALGDRGAEACHAVGQPAGDASTVERKIGVAGASHLNLCYPTLA